MRRNIRYHLAVLFAVVGLSLSGYGAYKLQKLPVYTEQDLALAAELNLSFDLARLPPERQPAAEKLPEMRATVAREISDGIKQQRSMITSWIQTGFVLIGMAILQALLQSRLPTPPPRA
ncbi:hypothetical protein [Nevskia sp.]|uniref:hypothetical protein n=1 Tax=Nevskia sp. TaxID=1929292 RepID=UPI0025F228F8|nr:hypothetical protein [Nevskia sp.]